MLVKGIEMKKIVFLGSIIVGGAVFAADGAKTASSVNDFDGVYVGVGGAFSHPGDKASVVENSMGIENPEICHRKDDLFGISTVVGYGQVFRNNVYLGGEFLVDVFRDKKFSGNYEWEGSVPYNGKFKGVVPSVALRLGYCVDSFDTVFYGRVGAAYVRADFYDGFIDEVAAGIPNVEKYGQYHNVSQIAPVIGIGIEKKFGAFGVRLEGDCRLIASKRVSEGFRVNGQEQKIKVRNRLNGYTIRLMATYNFR